MGLSKILAKRVSDYQNTNSLGARFRAKRIAPLIKMINDTYKRYGRVDIIDIGGTKTYWAIIPEKTLLDNNVSITLINISGTFVPTEDQIFSFRVGNGCDLSEIDDNSFHIAHSNSVIEHVGGWDQMVQFAHEISRVSNNYFVQTPYFWFPIEPHFMTPFYHWLPIPLRVSLLMKFNLGHRRKQDNVDGAVQSVVSIQLLDKKMYTELFPDAIIIMERIFLLPKSMIAVKFEPDTLDNHSEIMSEPIDDLSS